MLQKINSVLLDVRCISNPVKRKCISFCKHTNNTTVFNTDNNQKYFLSIKSEYYNYFWRSCDTEYWRNDAENTAAHHRNKLHFKVYSYRKQLISIEIIFHNISVFTVLFIYLKKASFVSRQYFFPEQINPIDPKLLNWFNIIGLFSTVFVLHSNVLA